MKESFLITEKNAYPQLLHWTLSFLPKSLIENNDPPPKQRRLS